MHKLLFYTPSGLSVLHFPTKTLRVFILFPIRDTCPFYPTLIYLYRPNNN